MTTNKHIYRERGKAAYRSGLPMKPSTDLNFQEKIAWTQGFKWAERN